MQNRQIEIWKSEFGSEYTERNKFKDENEFNQLYISRYGRTRDDINKEWLADLPRDARILEVGCNIGNQLGALQRLGFTNLTGIEIQRECVEYVKKTYQGIDVIEASALDIPFKTGWFDMAFTNNVLIHISPKNIETALAEIARVTCKFVWGFEYYAEDLQEIPYRGHENLLWKGDYRNLYQQVSPSLQLLREQRMPCLDEDGVIDNLFLLEK